MTMEVWVALSAVLLVALALCGLLLVLVLMRVGELEKGLAVVTAELHREKLKTMKLPADEADSSD